MPVKSVGFICKLNSVVCPIARFEGVGNPCVNPMILPNESYKCHTTLTFLMVKGHLFQMYVKSR
jgi:hypothetical protein